VEIFIFCLI